MCRHASCVQAFAGKGNFMKQFAIKSVLLLCVCLLSGACVNSVPGSTKGASGLSSAADTVAVRRTVSAGPFSSVSIMGRVDVVFAQSGRRAVVAEGTAGAIDYYKIEVADGMLSVQPKEKGVLDCYDVDRMPCIRLVVGSPVLSGIELGLASSFTAVTPLKSDLPVNISLSGVSKAVFGRVGTAKSFDVDASGVSKCILGEVACAGFSVDMSGCSTYESSDISVTGKADVSLSGKSTCKYGKLKCASFDSELSGNSSLTAGGKLSARRFGMELSGACDSKLSFSGGDADLSCSGASSMKIALDCKSVTADASGASKICLTGTAGQVSIDDSGASSVDTSGLSKR